MKFKLSVETISNHLKAAPNMFYKIILICHGDGDFNDMVKAFRR